MMRSLTARIVFAVIGTLLASLIAFFATFRAMSMPANARLIRSFQSHQIDQAVRTLREDGPDAAARFLAELNSSLDAVHYLTDPNGRDLITGEDRSALLRIPRPWFGPPEIDGRLVIVESSRDRQSRMLILASPPFNIWAFVPYYALILAAVACLCWLLAIGIVRPLRQVRHAVKRFGRGDLTTRVHLARRDEIGDLGRAFDEMAERIATLLTAERRLLQDISHELRSPLARLNIAIELARKGDNPDAAATRLQREADRLTAMVGSLIEVTRLEGDPAAQSPSDVSVADLVDTVVAGCELEAQARPCRVVARNQTMRTMFGHPELLRRALENVLRNAIRFAPPGSEVLVEAGESGAATEICVRDLGPGVPEADIPRLVQPFFRVDGARDAASGGVGLGLSIAHRAVHLHHGTLRIENAHPGLRVCMTFPDGRAIERDAVVHGERSRLEVART